MAGADAIEGWFARSGLVDWVESVESVVRLCDRVEQAYARGAPPGRTVPDRLRVEGEDVGIDPVERERNEERTLPRLYYLSPDERESPASDVYALGVILFRRVAGEFPFRGTNPVEVALEHRKASAPALSQLRPGAPEDLESVIARALEKRSEDRFESPAGLAEALRAVLARLAPGPGAEVGCPGETPAGADEPNRPGGGRGLAAGMVAAVAAGGVAILLAGAAILFLDSPDRSTDRAGAGPGSPSSQAALAVPTAPPGASPVAVPAPPEPDPSTSANAPRGEAPESAPGEEARPAKAQKRRSPDGAAFPAAGPGAQPTGFPKSLPAKQRSAPAAPPSVLEAPAAPVPADASSQPPSVADSTAAASLFAEAESLFRARAFLSATNGSAAAKYQRVLEIDPRNDAARARLDFIRRTYLDLADARTTAGDSTAARGYLEALARVFPADPEIEKRNAELTTRTERAQSTGKLAIRVNPWGRVFVDGRIAGLTPLAPLTLAAGRHHIEVQADGREDWWKDVLIEESKTTEIDVTLGENR